MEFSVMSVQYPCTGFAGRTQIQKQGFSDTFAVDEPAKAANLNPLIGRKVWTRRRADKKFYEAVITDYNPNEVYLVVCRVVC